MIGVIKKGSSFRAALEYNLSDKKGAYILDSNMAGETPRELVTEFGEIRKQRPNLKKAVAHISLSAAPGEKLSDNQWREIGERCLSEMGFQNNQYVMVRHTDTNHEHIHIVVNRITYTGEVVSDSFQWIKLGKIMESIEEDYGLKRIDRSQKAEKRAPTKNELEMEARTGEPSIITQLQELCDIAAKNCKTFTEYQKRLEAAGVEILPVVQLNGTKLSGVSYKYKDFIVKGSSLGRRYAAAGIQKRGISYDFERDFETVERILKSEESRKAAPETSPPPEATHEQTIHLI